MERALLFSCSPDELFELIKDAVRDVMSEQQLSSPVANPPPPLSFELLSAAQVCELLHISRPTLIKYTKQGKIKGKRIGGKLFYNKQQIIKNF